MAGQEFAVLVTAGVLTAVEEIVVTAHRDLYAMEGRPWSRPAAYHWLRYEDPAPVERLADGVRRLRGRVQGSTRWLWTKPAPPSCLP